MSAPEGAPAWHRTPVNAMKTALEMIANTNVPAGVQAEESVCISRHWVKPGADVPRGGPEITAKRNMRQPVLGPPPAVTRPVSDTATVYPKIPAVAMPDITALIVRIQGVSPVMELKTTMKTYVRDAGFVCIRTSANAMMGILAIIARRRLPDPVTASPLMILRSAREKAHVSDRTTADASLVT